MHKNIIKLYMCISPYENPQKKRSFRKLRAQQSVLHQGVWFEVCFGGMFRGYVSGYVSPSLVEIMGMIRGMIRGYDSVYYRIINLSMFLDPKCKKQHWASRPKKFVLSPRQLPIFASLFGVVSSFIYLIHDIRVYSWSYRHSLLYLGFSSFITISNIWVIWIHFDRSNYGSSESVEHRLASNMQWWLWRRAQMPEQLPNMWNWREFLQHQGL